MNLSAVLRSERLRPLTRLLAAWGVGAALGLFVASPLRAQSTGGSLTPAGTAVSNVATVSYETQNGSAVTVSGSVTFIVGQVAGVDVDPPRIAISEAGREVVFSHDVMNVGNGADAFMVTASTPSGWSTRVFHDVDGDGLLTPADTLVTGSLPVARGGQTAVLVAVVVPTDAVAGTIEPVVVSSVSDFDPSVSDTVSDEIRLVDAGIDPIVQKAVDVTEAAPGDLLTYTIRVRLEGAGARDSVFFADDVPAFATYEAGTLLLDGVALTDVADADEGRFEAGTGTIRVDLSALPSDTEATILLQMRVDDDAPIGSQVVNRGHLTIHTPSGTLPAESGTPVTHVSAPDLTIRKAPHGLNPATEGDTLVYTIEVENPSTTLAATDIVVIDSLPALLTLVDATPAATVVDSELRWDIARIEPGATARFDITTVVPAVTDTLPVVNRAFMVRDGAAGESAESEPRTVMPDVEASLALGLEAEVVEIGLGEALPLEATTTNDGPATLVDLVVKLALPVGTRFIDQAALTGRFIADRPSPQFVVTTTPGASTGAPATVQSATPSGAPQGPALALGDDFTATPFQVDSFQVVGDTLHVWLPGELRPAEAITFRYLLMIDSAPDGVVVNEAIAEARRGTLAASSTIAVASNQAQALVGVTRNRALETRTVVGKVFHDIDGNDVQDADEPGVAGVDVVTADGELVTTDAYGKFSLTNLRPGRHALRIDPLTLPEGLTARRRGIGERLQVVEINGWNTPRVIFAVDGAAQASVTAGPVPGADGEESGDAREESGTDGAGSTAEHAQGANGTGAASQVRVDALRSDDEREADQRSAFLHGPAIRIHTPVDGVVAPTNRLYIGVTAEPMAPVALFRDDELVAEGQLMPNGDGDFIGVELKEGPQLFRVRSTNSWGNERWDSVRVHQSGPPASFVFDDEGVTLLADGRTQAATRVRLLDAWGVPVVTEPLVTVRSDVADFAHADADRSSVGHQLRADAAGWLTVPLVGGRQTGEGLLEIRTADAVGTLPLRVVAPVRPLLVTGVGQVSVGSAGEDFGALTARGRIGDETALTLSFDSRRLDQGRDVFGRNFDPLEEGQHPILGDASSQRSLVSSRYRFSALVERGLDWMMVGDVETSGFSDGLSLARYGRSLPGVAGRVTTGAVTWQAFGAATTQALQQLQLRGEGSSGPFELGPGVLPGTEIVRVEVRALENPTRVISEQRLVRFIEYQIDYRRGILLLKQPVPAADAFGNPVFLTVTYEGESGGERNPVWGVRGSSDLGDVVGSVADSVPVTVSFVNDAQDGRSFRMGALKTGIVSDGRELSVELALAEGADSTGLATRVKAVAPDVAGRVDLAAEWSKVGDEFTNPANIALRPGTEELRASAGLDVGAGRVDAAWERQNFASRDLERSRGTVGYTQAVREDVEVEARLAADASSTGGTESSSGAGEYKVTWSATPRLDVFAQGRNELWADGEGLANRGSYYGGGAALKLADAFGLEARHLRVDPTGDANPYSVTSIGLTSSLRTGTRAWGAYEISGGTDGSGSTAGGGQHHRFALGSAWRCRPTLERRRIGLAVQHHVRAAQRHRRRHPR